MVPVWATVVIALTTAGMTVAGVVLKGRFDVQAMRLQLKAQVTAAAVEAAESQRLRDSANVEAIVRAGLDYVSGAERIMQERQANPAGVGSTESLRAFTESGVDFAARVSGASVMLPATAGSHVEAFEAVTAGVVMDMADRVERGEPFHNDRKRADLQAMRLALVGHVRAIHDQQPTAADSDS